MVLDMQTKYEWRGFDLTKRREKIVRAFNMEEVACAEDVPVVVNTPNYFGFGAKFLPENYYIDPAVMVNHQADGHEKHLTAVNDDLIPYFMPWFGTGVLANAFGCEIKMPEKIGQDPAIVSTCINSISDIVKLKMPTADKDGLMPRVLEFIDYAKENSDLPPGLTDMNGILSTVCQMCGYENLFIWMYEEPKAVHDLFEIVTQSFIEWTKIQKRHIGEPLDCSNGLQGIWSPKGGVWMSDDDLTILSPKLYEEFVVPYASRIYKEFGGGSLHFCGDGYYQVDNILKIENLTAVNNSPMADYKAFGDFVNRLSGHIAIQIQDNAPINIERNYSLIFNEIEDLKGIIIAPFVIDTLGMNDEGQNIPVNLEPFEVANRIVTAVRKCVGEKLKAGN